MPAGILVRPQRRRLQEHTGSLENYKMKYTAGGMGHQATTQVPKTIYRVFQHKGLQEETADELDLKITNNLSGYKEKGVPGQKRGAL